MDKPFTFDSFVTGKYFIGREEECRILSNMLISGSDVSIYESPKYGITSTIRQTLLNLRVDGKEFYAVELDLFNIRNIDSFMVKLGSEVMKACCQTPQEYREMVGKYLSGTHFVFDFERFDNCGEAISTNWDLDKEDFKRMLGMAGAISKDQGKPIYIILGEFQRLYELEGAEDLMRTIREVLQEKRSCGSLCTWLFTGSQVNAMKVIFRHKTYFSTIVSHLELKPIDNSLIVEYIRSCFNLTGKVIDREIAMGPGKLFEGNMWYINHFLYICDSLTKGYINDRILIDALGKMISIHGPRFKVLMESLTGHQTSFLMAVVDEETRFSSSEVIRKYRLNSSANVLRVKDALMKKEIITTGEKDEIIILDPLFKYWLRNYFYL